MFPAARLTGLGEERLNMHEFLCLANTGLKSDPGPRIS